MKKILFLIFLFFLSKSIFAQNNQNVYAIYDVSKSKNGVQLNSIGQLQINNTENKSLFILSQYKNLIKQEDKISKENNTLFLNKRKICFDNYFYQYDYKNNQSMFELYDYSCDTKRIISEQIQNPNWKIEKYNKKVLGYSVNKATAKINDRVWTVFYSTKVKTKFNPWRFTGLNGLIILAEDKTKTYTFKLNKLLNKETRILEFPNQNIEKSDFKSFKSQVINEYWKNIEMDLKSNNMIFNKDDLPKYETLEFIEN